LVVGLTDVGAPKLSNFTTNYIYIEPMKPFISNMFRMHKTLDVVTLFHKPSVQASTRIATLLKQASAQSQEHATEDQASDHSAQHSQRDPFELDITEAPPTSDQLKSIFEYVGSSKAAQLVKGASSPSEALKKLKEDSDSFLRPVVSSNWSDDTH
jgi:Protein of unknown function (DUF1687)